MQKRHTLLNFLFAMVFPLALLVSCSSGQNTTDNQVFLPTLISPNGEAPVTNSSIRIAPTATAFNINETFEVPVVIENINDATAYEVHLSFNSTVLDVTEIKDGGFITPDYVLQNLFDNNMGSVDYAAAQIERTPASGNGTLITIVFRAKSAGTSEIAFRNTPAALEGALLSDSKGTAIPIRLVNGSVVINNP